MSNCAPAENDLFSIIDAHNTLCTETIYINRVKVNYVKFRLSYDTRKGY